jgi:ribonuclease HII
MMKLSENFSGELLEAGCDEAGRGCLAGPVFAAAVILNPNNPISGLNDSKQLTESKRMLLKDEIMEKALCWSVAQVSEVEIDKMNILNASIFGMHKALDELSQVPNFIIVDGNRFKSYKNIPFKTIVKGDAKFQSISAASILAKTFRDEFMEKIHEEFPVYQWDRNKGYPTKVHRNAIYEHGSCVYHRKTFNLLGDLSQYSLFD